MSPQPDPSTQTEESCDAGPFGPWLTAVRRMLLGRGETLVPCGSCIGCCASSYYVPLRPTDAPAIARIPVRFIVRSPSQAQGHALLRASSDGACPMHDGHGCSIYDVRPQTCRDYDCRIFAAAGIDAGDATRDTINRRVRAWRFTYAEPSEAQAHAAVRAAAATITRLGGVRKGNALPTAPTGIAVLAIKTYGLFLSGTPAAVDDPSTLSAIIAESRRFDGGGAD